MSKIIDLLNEAMEGKEKGHDVVRARKNKKFKPPKAPMAPSVIVILLILVLFNIGLTFRLFAMMKDYAYANNDMVTKLHKLEGLLTDNAHQLSTFSKDAQKANAALAGINLKTQDYNLEITRLNKQNRAQGRKIEGLAKDNSKLFNHIAHLKEELKRLKKGN